MIKTACTAMKSDERTPYARDTSDGAVAVSGIFEGAIPKKKPPVTNTLANMTFRLGTECVLIEETMIVSGSTSPLAIWKKDACTSLSEKTKKGAQRR